MWKQAKPLLGIVSIALNVAFLGVWIAYAAAARIESRAGLSPRSAGGPVSAEDPIWCPLHRELNVSVEQWKQIEPRLQAFRASADEVCRQIAGLRGEIIDELASPTSDLETIKAKQEEILAHQRKMQGLVIGQLTTEKEVLTAPQQQQLFQMLRGRTACERGGSRLSPGSGHRGGMGQVLRTGGQD